MSFFNQGCVLQHDESDCAAACISTILKEYKQEVSIIKIREIIGTDLYGTTLKGIVEGLEKIKFNVRAIRVKAKDMDSSITLPAIAQIKTTHDYNHFVVVLKVKRNKIVIADPAIGIRKLSISEFEDIFEEVLILTAPSSEFEKLDYKDKGMIELFKALIFPQKKTLGTIVLASILLSILGIIISTFSKILMDEIIPYQLKSSLIVLLVIFGFMTLFQNLLSSFRQQMILFLERKVDLPLLMGYYNHIIHLPYTFFTSRKVGDIITRFQDAMTIKDIFTSLSISLLFDVSLSLITAIVLFCLNSTLFIILLVVVIINIMLVYLFKKPYRKFNYEMMESQSVLNSHIIESMTNVETVKALNSEKMQIEKLENRFVNFLKINYKVGTFSNVQNTISGFLNSISSILMMGVGALLIIDKKITIGDLLVFQTLSQYFTEPIQSLVNLQLTFQEANVAMKRLSELMSLEREDNDNYTQINNVDLRGDITINNLNFSYGSRPPILKGLSLLIKQGQKVALVGESGSGKTTIAKLLLKLLGVKNGSITINNYDINDLDKCLVRNKIAYIQQNIQLFSGSIIDNLRLGNENATIDAIMAACKASGASSFIDSLPNRYKSHIEEGGSNLSGGEKQRLAIARAMLANCDIYIFDEATSNLDSFSERKIHNLIFTQLTDKTVIIIAHRLSTIVNCDYIYLLNDGKVEEHGSYDELIKNDKRFADMVRFQYQGYLKNKEDEESDVIEYA